MIKRISVLCVLWVAPLALGQESQVSQPQPKANDSKATAPEPSNPAQLMTQAVPLTEALATPAPGNSSSFSQFPPGFSMDFEMSGSFNLSFNMKVDKDQAKEKTHKGKTKKKATEKAKSKPKTEKTQ